MVSRALIPVVRGTGRALFDLELTGIEHVPEEGGLVVAANHLSHIDPLVVTASVGREVRYIAVDELFGSGAVFDAVTLFFGAIPTNRDGAPTAASHAGRDRSRTGMCPFWCPPTLGGYNDRLWRIE